MNRILTLEVEILDKEQAEWIWDNHGGKDTGNGIYVRKIQDGEIPEDENFHHSAASTQMIMDLQRKLNLIKAKAIDEIEKLHLE